MSEILCYPLRLNPWTEVEEHGWMEGWMDGWMDGWQKRSMLYLLITFMEHYVGIQNFTRMYHINIIILILTVSE